jgi:hypothetical protein
MTTRIVRRQDDESRQVTLYPFADEPHHHIIVWQQRFMGGNRGWAKVTVWWPGNPSGTPQQAAQLAEALAEAARIAAEWAKEDTTSQIALPRRR